MSFPNKVLKQVYLSEQDKKDILFGIEHDVDYIACSFVSSAQDIMDVKEFIASHTDKEFDIIAKTETQTAFQATQIYLNLKRYDLIV